MKKLVILGKGPAGISAALYAVRGGADVTVVGKSGGALEKAGLINTTIKQKSRGSSKICSRRHDSITIRLTANDPNVNMTHSISMPVGCVTDCHILPGCGIVTERERIGPDDQPEIFYLPKHVHAQLLWSAGGYVEYLFPYQLPEGAQIEQMTVSFEACSEAYNYK